MTTIGDRLRLAREREEITQEAWRGRLEERAGYEVSKAAVSKYELGTTVPAAYAAAACDAFGLSPDWLLWGRGPMERPDPGVEARAYRVISEVVRSVDETGGISEQSTREALKAAGLVEADGSGDAGKGAA